MKFSIEISDKTDMSSIESKVNDLEDGEIEDDTFEDISECSLSDTLDQQEDLNESDVELLREEALKSLQKNKEVDDEVECRIEALKSLLKNMESSEKTPVVDIESPEIISPTKKTGKRKRKRKKKRKSPSKYFKVDNVSEKSNFFQCDERIPTLQTNWPSETDFSNKENQVATRDVKLVSRSWYPRTDFALLNPSDVEVSNEKKQQPKKHRGTEDFIIVPRILAVANNGTRPTGSEPILKGEVNQNLKPNPQESPVTPASASITRSNVSVRPTITHLSQYKKVSNHHIRKYPVTPPVNKYSLRNVKKGKYKLVNKTCYSLKKPAIPLVTKTEKPNILSKSVYSLNRIKNKPPIAKHSELIIQLDEDESGKEDDGVIFTDEQKRMSPEIDGVYELPPDLADDSISHITENESLDESVISTSVIENESNTENFDTSLMNDTSVYLENDEPIPFSEVTPLTTSCCDTLLPFKIEDTSSIYSEEDSFHENESPRMTNDAIKECDTNFPIHSNSPSGSKQLVEQELKNVSSPVEGYSPFIEESELMDAESCSAKEYDSISAVEEEELNAGTAEEHSSHSIVEEELEAMDPEACSEGFDSHSPVEEDPMNAEACAAEENNLHVIVEEQLEGMNPEARCEEEYDSLSVVEEEITDVRARAVEENNSCSIVEEKLEGMNPEVSFEVEYDSHSMVENGKVMVGACAVEDNSHSIVEEKLKGMNPEASFEEEYDSQSIVEKRLEGMNPEVSFEEEYDSHSIIEEKLKAINPEACFEEEYDSHSIVEKLNGMNPEAGSEEEYHSQSIVEKMKGMNPEAEVSFEKDYDSHSIVEKLKGMNPEACSEDHSHAAVEEEEVVHLGTFPAKAFNSHPIVEVSNLVNARACSMEEYNSHSVFQEIEPISIDNLKMEALVETDVASVTEPEECKNLKILQEAESDLIEIRARLLLNLGDLEESMKKDESEREKLNKMLKKLIALKSAIFKFEDKIRAHKTRVLLHSDTMQALLKEIVVGTDTCDKKKDVCYRVGTEIMGLQYKPPDVYENAINEKISSVDFSKVVSALASSK